jgi:hypothetical protein
MTGEIVGQQRGEVALQRRDLFDAGTQRRERVGAVEHFDTGCGRYVESEPKRLENRFIEAFFGAHARGG